MGRIQKNVQVLQVENAEGIAEAVAFLDTLDEEELI